ncbi:hypothetical protein F0562_021694 [Nyssa sinensis]|uniref:DOMON domain-containing protein n=1 Tax=Nyssa sinensis TaxID=561372 RepID=A0A5J5BN42_9ASTE|nr:hypothetical protein F0562_021694 [Nyssa sinensis]
MAPLRLRFSALILGFSVVLFLLILPSHSLTCSSQNFTNSQLYANCTDLQSLGSYLHWTYNSTGSSLSIAFIAPPAKSDGWIAWAINPTGTGMAGAQALIAFKGSNGSMTVNTYNISSYGSIVQSKILYPVTNKSAEQSGGLMKIFATLTLPQNTTTVNQVWQVGGSVTGGHPDKHEFLPANLMAKATLNLTVEQSNDGTPTGSNATAPSSTNGTAAAPSSNDTGAYSKISKSSVGQRFQQVSYNLLDFRSDNRMRQNKEPLGKFCNKNTNISINSPISANIDRLLPQLISGAALNGFVVTSYGKPENQVYGLAQCRGDVSSSKDCLSCILDAASEILKRCPELADARIW